ncbi:MAG: diphthine--ammonia ligase [Acidobacteria bacterium]|nr:diphthine--ammonia ligase [Acidobacteriota bacterium]
MNKNNKTILAWSGGKDSAMALYELKRVNTNSIAALLTTVTEGYNRISMHGVRRRLLLEQAAVLGYPLEEITIPQNCSNDIYENRMQTVLEKYRQQGVSAVAFGDLFLQDIRSYREKNMNRIGMQAIFPLWKKNTVELAQEFIRLGFRAFITCVDTQVLDREFSGREYDEDFLKDLPDGIDPCGENGEFHSFVYDGPIFSKPVHVERGEKVLRNKRFYYCDLV